MLTSFDAGCACILPDQVRNISIFVEINYGRSTESGEQVYLDFRQEASNSAC